MPEHDDLLDAVDALTRPVVIHLPQIDDDGKWLRAHTTELPPLLTQLQTAIAQSMSGKGGGGNPATRGVLDSDALFRFTKIATTVGDWCRIENVTPTRNPTVDLRRWYAARLANTDRDDRFYIRELHAWAGQIETKLDPPRRLEITAPCPECEAASYWENGESHPFPVVMEYQEHSTDILRTARAVCRSCEHQWTGSSELRALRWEIDTQTPQMEGSST